MKSKLIEEFNTLIGQAKIEAFANALNNNPNTKLLEAIEFSKKCGLENLTLDQCFRYGKFGISRKSAKELSLTAEGSAHELKKSKTVSGYSNTITKNKSSKRDEIYESMKLFMINNPSWLSASSIFEGVGPSLLGRIGYSFKQSINRLIEDGLVEYKGKSPNTMYRYIGNSMEIKKDSHYIPYDIKF